MGSRQVWAGRALLVYRVTRCYRITRRPPWRHQDPRNNSQPYAARALCPLGRTRDSVMQLAEPSFVKKKSWCLVSKRLCCYGKEPHLSVKHWSSAWDGEPYAIFCSKGEVRHLDPYSRHWHKKKSYFIFFYFETSMQCGSLFIWINRNAQRKQYKEIFACANLTDHLKHSTLYKKALNNSNSLFISWWETPKESRNKVISVNFRSKVEVRHLDS